MRLGPARAVLLALGFALAPAAGAAEQSVAVLIEPRVDVFVGAQSWLDRGLGKLDDGLGSDGALVDPNAHAALDYGLQLDDAFALHASFDAYGGEYGWLGITEAWLGYAPVPSSAWQYRVRAGALIPPFSLENGGTGWTATLTLTPSLQNDWIGEELHVNALEFGARRLASLAGSDQSFGFRVAAFTGNDTAGTVLAWRGWAANDRVTPLAQTLSLPDRLAFRSGQIFDGVVRTDPFLEIDGRLGWYGTGEWEYGDRLLVRYGRYDNRADPLAFAEGQVGWRTRFDSFGLRWKASDRLDVIAQRLAGDTLAGAPQSGFGIYNAFASWFLLTSYRADGHRLSVRYERFEVRDEDTTPTDLNAEDGRAWTVAYEFAVAKDCSFGFERLWVQSTRPDRAQIGLPAEASERRARFALRWSF